MSFGEKLRKRSGLVVFGVSVLLLVLLTNLPRKLSFGVLLGTILVFLCIWGLLKSMGAFVPRKETSERAQDVDSEDKEEFSPAPPPNGFKLDAIIVFIGLILYLPMLGSGGLWDPWETHYGEVSRRMLEMDDWISMWWENEWFYSKPVLIMWLDALGMAMVNSNPYPDGQFFGAAWGMRLPVALLAILCAWGVFHFVSRFFSKRAGVLASLSLLTMPTYVFLAHQTMTDMPYVACMSLALCLLACALDIDPKQVIKGKIIQLPKIGEIELNSHQIIVALVTICVLPFNLYLLFRPMQFYSGSFGQGNVRLESQYVIVPLGVIGLIALGGLGWLLWTLRDERRTRSLYLLGGYIFVGLAVLGKVLPGLVLPGMVLFFYLLTTGRWKDLRNLEIGRGLLILAIVILPWYIAVVFRHGAPFIDRIIFHDVVNRAVVGVHGDTGTLDYYIQQLGYGVFPWVLFVPLAFLGFKWQANSIDSSSQVRARVFILIWFLSFFVFFSAVITKFHHYIFPVLIPLSILIGIACDDLFAKRIHRPEPVLLAGMVLLFIVGRDLMIDGERPGLQRLVNLFTYKYTRPWPEGEEYDYSMMMVALVVGSLLCSFPLMIPYLRKVGGVVFLVFALVYGCWISNVFMPQIGDHWSQANLFEEYYKRREGEHERIIAFQMNWKGENFYTGNRAVIKVSLKTEDFEKWVQEHAGERHFFITERTRYERMRSALNRARQGAGTRLEEIGAPPGPDRGKLCNKFRIGVTTL